MSFFRRCSKKYHVTSIDYLVPNQVNQNDAWRLKTQHALLVAELKHYQKTKSQENLSDSKIQEMDRKTKMENMRIKMDYLKKRARSIEEQIMMELKNLHEVHREEVKILKKNFRHQNLMDQRNLEAYFRRQKSQIESIVYKYTLAMLEMDPTATKEFENMLKKMLDDMGMEAESVIWGRKRKSRWCRLKKTLRKLF